MSKKLGKEPEDREEKSRAGEDCSSDAINGTDRAAWVARLSQKDVAPLVSRFPRIEGKPDEAYLVQGWSAAERSVALVNHYDFFAGMLPAEVLYSLYCDDLPLVQLVDTAGNWFGIKLMPNGRFVREGELTLLLQSTSSTKVAAQFMFTVCLVESRPVIVIGGLEWLASSDQTPEGNSFTCADADFIAWRCLCELARIWQIRRVHAVNDLYRIRNLNSLSALLPRVDIFWTNQGAIRAGAWAWELPLDHTAGPTMPLLTRLNAALAASLATESLEQTLSKTPIVACSESDLCELKLQNRESQLWATDSSYVNRSL